MTPAEFAKASAAGVVAGVLELAVELNPYPDASPQWKAWRSQRLRVMAARHLKRLAEASRRIVAEAMHVDQADVERLMAERQNRRRRVA
jgi:hypothetical protein